MKSEREQVAVFGRKLREAGLVTGTFGNVSLCGPASGLTAISPSGLPYDAVGAADAAVVDLDGRRAEGAPALLTDAQIDAATAALAGDHRP